MLAEDALVDAQAVDGDGAVLGAAGDELGARVEADVVDGAGVRGETANLDAVRVEDVDAAGLGAERDEALRRARARREVGREELGDAAAQAAVLEYRLLLRILGRRGRGVEADRQREDEEDAAREEDARVSSSDSDEASSSSAGRTTPSPRAAPEKDTPRACRAQ